MAVPWIGQDGADLMASLYHLGQFPLALNDTLVALIPKRVNAFVPQDYRSISLVNVIYILTVRW